MNKVPDASSQDFPFALCDDVRVTMAETNLTFQQKSKDVTSQSSHCSSDLALALLRKASRPVEACRWAAVTPVTLGIVVAAPRLRRRAGGANSGANFVAIGMEMR